MAKRSVGEKIFDSSNIALFVAFCLTILYPIYQIALNSFSTETDIISGFREGLRLLPKKLYLDNWKTVLSSKMMRVSFLNSVVITFAASLYSLVLSMTYAFPLSRRDLPHRNFWTFILVFTMFFSGGLIPYYLLMRALGLLNTRMVLIIGTINAWNTLIMRNYFMTIPDSLQESARIDGASEATILWRIIFPVAIPVVATVFLWNLVGNWNSWVPAMIYINDTSKQVIQIALRNILTEAQYNIMAMNPEDTTGRLLDQERIQKISNEGMKATVLLFSTLPILLSYPFLQKYFVKGIMIGSLKG